MSGKPLCPKGAMIMKQQSNPSNKDVVDVLVKLQEQVNNLDKKVDLLMGRMMATPALMANTPSLVQEPQRRERPQFKITCAACGKEAILNFKPNADRPVYCKDCYVLRKRSAVVAVKDGPIRAEDGPIRAEEGYTEMAPSISPVKETVKAPAPKRRIPARRPASRPRPAAKRKK